MLDELDSVFYQCVGVLIFRNRIFKIGPTENVLKFKNSIPFASEKNNNSAAFSFQSKYSFLFVLFSLAQSMCWLFP